MNNFVFSQDPLLFQSVLPKQTPTSFQETPDLKQEYDTIFAQYQAMQQKNQPPQTNRDYLGDLDNLTRDIDPDIVEKLTNDLEYNKINAELQYLIQTEMLRSVKWKINNNPDAVSKIEKLTNLIQSAKKEKNDENNK